MSNKKSLTALEKQEKIFYSKIEIPSLKRNFYIAKNAYGVCDISFSGNEKQFIVLLKNKYRIEAKNSPSDLKNEVKQIQEYFEGKRKTFKMNLSIKGTEFQKKIWNEIAKIPYGETVSYSKLAQRIKNKNALRAAGTACGNNPIPIVIPCHRVIAKDGSIGGFGGGISLKIKMLDLERNPK